MIAYGTPFDPNNPPARMFWEAGYASAPGYNLHDERAWAELCLERHKNAPDLWSRPVMIIRLKAWKSRP